MAPRAYIRVLTDLVDKKVAAGYSDTQIVAYLQTLLKGALQPKPGCFVNRSVLKGWLGKYAKNAPHLELRRDLVPTDDGLYIEGWEEIQEGDLTVADRMRRYRTRKKGGQEDLPLERNEVTKESSNSVTANTANAIANADAVTKQTGKGDAGERVFRAWAASLPEGSRVSFTSERRRKVEARLDQYPVEQLQAAVSIGWKNDPWPERPQQNDLAILLRNDTQAEKFINLALNGPPPPVMFKQNGVVARLQARRAALRGAFTEQASE